MTRRMEEIYVSYGSSSYNVPRNAVFLGGRFRNGSMYCWYMYEESVAWDRIYIDFKLQTTWDAIADGWRWLCVDIDTHGSAQHVFYRPQDPSIVFAYAPMPVFMSGTPPSPSFSDPPPRPGPVPRELDLG
jgi:hypothetical protein